jgi:transcriptional regulator with XRE-family HTH domain
MDYSINKRIKELREKLGLNQREFSKLLSLSGGYIAGVEVNLRKVNDRLIKLIVSQFGVNEEWLRSGNSEMFSKKRTDEKAVRILSLFNDLPPHYQDVVLGTIDLLRKAKETENGLKKQKTNISRGRKARNNP